MTSLSFLECDAQTGAFGALLARLSAKSTLFDQDVEGLRQAFYRDGPCNQRRAAEIFHANRAMSSPEGAWIEFYLEALTDFLLDMDREGYRLGARSQATLFDWLGDDVLVVNLGERRLLARVMLRADDVSDRFERLVFASFRHHLLRESERWTGGQIGRRGGIDALDLQMIRRLIIGRRQPLPKSVSAAGFDFLFELDRHALQFAEPRAWLDLLTEGAALHLCDRSKADVSISKPILDVETSASIRTMLIANHPPAEAAELGDDIVMQATRLLEVSCSLRPAKGRCVSQ